MHKDIREIKSILLKNVIPKTLETTTKVEEVLDANWRRQSQSWASVVENQKNIERKISYQHNIGSVVNEAVDTSRQKMERDNVERKLCECNCMIQNILESTARSNSDKKEEDTDKVIQIMNVDSEYIINVRRAGVPKPDRVRPVIITLSTPELAAEMHNHGRGNKRVNNANHDEVYWINPDLIKTDRVANYQARKEAQKRRQDGQRRRDDRPRQREHRHQSAGTDSPRADYRRGSFLRTSHRRESLPGTPPAPRDISQHNSPLSTPQGSPSRSGNFQG